jgi:hypothetical protein
MPTNPATESPRRQRLQRVIAEGPESRSHLYREAAKHPGLFIKRGRAVDVDLDVLDEIRRSHPPAIVKSATGSASGPRPARPRRY